MTKKPSIFKQIYNYAIGEVGLKLIALIGLPIIASLLTVDEFGKAETAASIISIGSIVIVMGIDTALKRYYYEKDINYADFIKFALRTYFLLCAIVIVLLAAFNIIAISVLSIEFEFGIVLLNIAIIACLFKGLKSIYTSDLQIKRKSMRISIINLLQAITVLVLSIILLKYISASAVIRISVILIISIPLFIYCLSELFKIKKDADKKIEHKKLIKYTVSCGLPIAINQISGFVLGFIDRFMIIAFFGYAETGLYSYAYKIGMVVMVFTAVVSRTMLPEFFEAFKAKDTDKVKHLMREFSGYGIEATAVLMLLYKEIVLLITPSAYVSSTYIVFIIFIGYLCKYLYNFYTQVEYYYKQTKVITIVSAGGAIVNIVLNLILMQFFGYEVAAITTFISFALIYLAHYLYCKKKFSFKVFGIDKISFMFLALAFVPFIMELFDVPNMILLISKGIILVIMIAISRIIRTVLAALKNRKNKKNDSTK